MRKIKKVLIILVSFLVLLPLIKIKVNASDVPITKSDGNGDVTYIGTNVKVTIPSTYSFPETSFRAVWISAFTGDISGFSSEAQYKQEMIDVFEILEYYNINAMIFHVRARNDAFYESKYNKWSSYYSTNPSWDALPWIIEECHKRGIEFHAWLNPYRVSTSAANLEQVAKNFKANNPASNPDNLLKADSCVILNPGLPNVRKFLINTCMELIENYDVDAIHFDDYFYASGVDDSQTYAMYNSKGLSLGDWRREQVNLFIKGLSDEMRSYNEKTGRRVQLGIAPSGIWKSAGGSSYVKYDEDGNAITNGSSTTSSFEHYGGHLYADTLKWINEEWIDYILPQTYWAIEHGSAGYPDLVKWWAEVVKYKKVNLYVALGMYMRNESGGSSWKTNDLEGFNQIMYGSNYETVKGYSVYEYKSLRAAANGSDRSFKRVNELWSNPSILPEIRTMDKIVIDNPKNLSVGKVEKGYKLEFDEVEKAKFYVIYRSENELTYSASEVIDVIGGNLSINGKVNYVDLINNEEDYYYGVKAQSYSLTLTFGVYTSTNGSAIVDNAQIEKVDTVITSSDFLENTNMDIKWKKIYHYIGEEVNYELYYSSDNVNWIKNEQEIILNDGNGYASTKLKIGSNVNKIYFKIRAYNDYGESYSDIYDLNIYKKLGLINHFSIIGNPYYGETVEFVWNNLLDYSDIKYFIQKSYDGLVYEDVIEVQKNDKINIRYNYLLSDDIGKIYFRIKGEADGRVGYSNEKVIEIKKNLGSIQNYKVNNEEANDYYVLKEEDELIVTYNANNNLSYVPRLSRNGKTWMVASKVDSFNTIEIDKNTYKQRIYISGLDLKLYFYVEVTGENAISKTNLFEIYVIPEYVFYDDLISFMQNEQNLIINKNNIFN